MGAEVSKVNRICGRKKTSKAANSADPNNHDPADDEFPVLDFFRQKRFSN